MTKLLVTGGAGFIGSEFVRQGVRRGYRITVFDKLSYAGDLERLREVDGEINFLKGDVTERQAIETVIRAEKADVIVHWAAESHVDRSISDAAPFIDVNIRGTQVLLESAKKYGIDKFVNISTDEVYGDLREEGHFSETTALNPSSPYSVSKASADMLGRAYQRTYGLPVITVRPSNNYGPWQFPEKLIPVAIWKAFGNKKVPVYARGENVREWLFVSDCADAVFELIEKGKPGEVYNVGSGEEKSNIDVVKAILNVLGRSEELIEFVKDRPGHDFRYSLNSDKIEEQIGWKRKTLFSEGLERTVKWYVDNMEWVRRKIV